MEQWKPVIGYEGLYEISDAGSLRIVKSQKISKLTQQDKKQGGYLVATLIKYVDGRRLARTKRIHRLVAEAFIPNPDNKPCIDHINTDPTDNRVTNLRWVTYLENNRNPITWERHLKAHRTQEYHNKVTSPERRALYRSEEHIANCRAGAKWHAKPVVCVETGEVWESAQAASRSTGMDSCTINDMCKRAEKPDYKPMTIQNGNTVKHFRYYKQPTNQGEEK